MKKFFLLLFILALFGCTSNTKTFENEELSITLPKWVQPTKELNPNAPYQWWDPEKKFYIILNSESKQVVHDILRETEGFTVDFDGNCAYLMRDFKNMFLTTNIQEKEGILHGKPYQSMQLHARLQEYKFYYSVTYVETSDRYYQLVIWTDLDQKATYENLIQQISTSLKIKKP